MRSSKPLNMPTLAGYPPKAFRGSYGQRCRSLGGITSWPGLHSRPMHSVSWPSILASALVALVVTLIVEYLAKPRLEARKDRIIEYNRDRRATLKRLSRAANLAMWLCDYYKRLKDNTTGTEATDHIDEEVLKTAHDHINDEALKVAREIEELIANTWGEVDVPAWMAEEWKESIERVFAFVTALRLTPAPQGYYVWSKPGDDMWGTFRAAVIRLNNLIIWQGMSNRHLRRKRKFVKEVRSSPLPPET